MPGHAEIPLHCTICEKNPRFSDISHLLTHISSKAHLAQRFKLGLAAQTDDTVRNRLANYDAWYEVNGLEALLADRMAAKEQKRSRKTTIFKASPITPQSSIHPELRASSRPRMHLWPTNLPQPAIYQTPTMQSYIPGFEPAPFADEDESKDMSKLKGIYWPGMDLFDSATADMKRKRNQKKDGSVLQKMKLSSLDVEPTEWVFESDGQFRKTRHIFNDSDTDESPDKSQSPSPKRRRTKRPTLQELSPNKPRLAPIIQKSQFHQLHHEATTSGINPLATRMDASVVEGFRLEDLAHVFRETDDQSPARTESPLEDIKLEYHDSPITRQTTPVPPFEALRTYPSAYPEHMANPLFQAHVSTYSYPDSREEDHKTY